MARHFAPRASDFKHLVLHEVDLNGKLSHEEKKALLIKRPLKATPKMIDVRLTYTVGQDGRDGKRKEWGSSETIRDYND